MAVNVHDESEDDEKRSGSGRRRRRARVAVVGCGAAGLAAARELKAEGHAVVVFEKGSDVGGVWVYDPSTESDALGVEASRTKIHSSMYASLRTNLPREVMGYESFPFTGVFAGDNRRFCGHAEVRAYLSAWEASTRCARASTGVYALVQLR